MARIVAFGEIMLRLSPPGKKLFFQPPQGTATFGGTESNVAVSLCNFGEETAFVTALPANPVGDSALKHTVYGNFNRIGKDDVLTLMRGNVSGRVQR